MKKIVLLIFMIAILIVSMSKTGENESITKDVVSSNESEDVVIYFPRLPDIKLVGQEIRLGDGVSKEEKIELVINELIKGADKANIIDVIPKGTKLNGVYVEKETAFVDFSQEFVDNHPGGSIGEYNTIYCIVNSITEIEGIESVCFFVDGEKQETYKGHIQFDLPIGRDESMIINE